MSTIEVKDTSDRRPLYASQMTMRDWFAGQALANSSISDDVPARGDFDRLTIDAARVAYAYADAMLKARSDG